MDRPAADPQVEAGRAAGAGDADERDVVDLVRGALGGAPADGGLVLAWQVGELRIARRHLLGRPQRRGGVEDLAGVDAGHRAAQDVAGHVAAGLQAGQADAVEPVPDLRHVLDPDPVELHVLPVGDVGQVPPVLLGDARHRAQLLRGELPARDADADHEELVLDLGVLQRPGLAPADPRAALGVQAPPAEPAAQVERVDRVETLVGVAGEDPLADVEPVVVFLELFGRVQRLEMAKRPLALAAMGPGWHGCFLLPQGAPRTRAVTHSTGRGLRFSGRRNRWRWRPGAGQRDDGTPGAQSVGRLRGGSRVQPPRLPACRSRDAGTHASSSSV